MKVTAALREGIRMACTQWRVVLLVYVVNLVVAAAVAIPLYQTIDSELSHTESAARMAEGYDWLWHQEFQQGRDPGSDAAATVQPWQQGALSVARNFESYVNGRLRSDLPASLIWFGVIYLLVSTFLTGGILGLFAERGSRFSFRFFFDRSGRHFTMLLGIMVIAQIVYWLLWTPLGGGLHAMVAAVGAEATTEWTPTLLGWLVSALLGFLGLAAFMTFNYCRVAVVAWDRLGLLPALLGGVFFSIKNLGRALGLFYLTALLPLAVIGLYALLSPLLSGATLPGLVIMALIQQGFIMTSIWIRMVYLASQMCFYRGTMNMPDWATPAGPPPLPLEDDMMVEETALT